MKRFHKLIGLVALSLTMMTLLEANKMIDNTEAGKIHGTLGVDESYSSMIVYAYADGTWDENTEAPDFVNAVSSAKATDKSFIMSWLSAGTYDLVVVGYDNISGYENIISIEPSVDVTAQGTTTMDIVPDIIP